MHLDITLKPGTWLDPNAFIKQIADAGYAARKDEIRLTLTGKLSQNGDRVLLLLEDVKPGPQTLLLVSGTSKDDKESKAMAEAWKQTTAKIGEVVEVEGYWKAGDTKKDKGALSTLTLTRLSPIKTEDKP